MPRFMITNAITALPRKSSRVRLFCKWAMILLLACIAGFVAASIAAEYVYQFGG